MNITLTPQSNHPDHRHHFMGDRHPVHPAGCHLSAQQPGPVGIGGCWFTADPIQDRWMMARKHSGNTAILNSIFRP